LKIATWKECSISRPRAWLSQCGFYCKTFVYFPLSFALSKNKELHFYEVSNCRGSTLTPLCDTTC